MTKNLGTIFGIALSSDGDPSTRVMACHALCACKGLGSFFLSTYFTNQWWQVVPGFVIHFRGDVSLICFKKQKQKTDGHGLLYRKI